MAWKRYLTSSILMQVSALPRWAFLLYLWTRKVQLVSYKTLHLCLRKKSSSSSIDQHQHTIGDCLLQNTKSQVKGQGNTASQPSQWDRWSSLQARLDYTKNSKLPSNKMPCQRTWTHRPGPQKPSKTEKAKKIFKKLRPSWKFQGILKNFKEFLQTFKNSWQLRRFLKLL